MRHLGIFVFGSLVTGLVAFAGCSSGSGGSGTGGQSASHTSSSGETTSSGTATTSSGTATTSSGTATTSSGTASTSSGTTTMPMGIHCNPVTNAGCTGGAACDQDQDSMANTVGFSCTKPPVDTPLCGDCSTTNCSAGNTCLIPAGTSNQVCVHYCCTDADCGTGNMCLTQNIFSPVAPNLGICVLTATPDGGDSGNFACTVPMTAPSMGSCVTVM